MVIVRKSLEDFSKLGDEEKIILIFHHISLLDQEIQVVISNHGVYCMEDVLKWKNPLAKKKIADKTCIDRYVKDRPVYRHIPKYKNLLDSNELIDAFCHVQAMYDVNFEFVG